jgi:hypothetical protein
MGLASFLNQKPKRVPNDSPAISPPCSPFNIECYGLSDRGQVRRSDEDCFLIAELARSLQVTSQSCSSR